MLGLEEARRDLVELCWRDPEVPARLFEAKQCFSRLGGNVTLRSSLDRSHRKRSHELEAGNLSVFLVCHSLSAGLLDVFPVTGLRTTASLKWSMTASIATATVGGASMELL